MSHRQQCPARPTARASHEGCNDTFNSKLLNWGWSSWMDRERKIIQCSSHPTSLITHRRRQRSWLEDTMTQLPGVFQGLQASRIQTWWWSHKITTSWAKKLEPGFPQSQNQRVPAFTFEARSCKTTVTTETMRVGREKQTQSQQLHKCSCYKVSCWKTLICCKLCTSQIWWQIPTFFWRWLCLSMLPFCLFFLLKTAI